MRIGLCDFCQMYQAKHEINDGLWWLCDTCMDREYGPCRCTEDLKLDHLSPCKFRADHPQGDEEE